MSKIQTQAGSFLESGTNELKILEYSNAGLNFGINILKTSRIISAPEKLTNVAHAHPAVRGIMVDLDITLPVVDLSYFLKLKDAESLKGPIKGRILVTEFFNKVTGFLVDKVNYVHTILWKRVFDAQSILGKLGSEYVIGIVRPDDKTNILLLDYEKIMLELSPGLEKIELGDKPEGIEGENRKILVAEDSAAVRDLLVVELTELGFDVLAAKDGLMALDIYNSTSDLSLVVTDVEMPQLEGLSLTKKIKEKTPDMPVIVYSSISDMGMKERAKNVNADAHVSKLNIGELLSAIQNLLEKKP